MEQTDQHRSKFSLYILGESRAVSPIYTVSEVKEIENRPYPINPDYVSYYLATSRDSHSDPH